MIKYYSLLNLIISNYRLVFLKKSSFYYIIYLILKKAVYTLLFLDQWLDQKPKQYYKDLF